MAELGVELFARNRFDIKPTTNRLGPGVRTDHKAPVFQDFLNQILAAEIAGERHMRWHSHVVSVPAVAVSPPETSSQEMLGSGMEASATQPRPSASRRQREIARVFSTYRLQTLIRPQLPSPRNEGVPGSSPGVGSPHSKPLESTPAVDVRGLRRYRPRAVDEREVRWAENEALFRAVNELIETTASAAGVDGHVYAFMCECADARCHALLPLTVREYERVRADPRLFLLAPGHERSEIETIVARHGAYHVVRKRAEAGEYVALRDPRER